MLSVQESVCIFVWRMNSIIMDRASGSGLNMDPFWSKTKSNLCTIIMDDPGIMNKCVFL